MNAGQVPHNEGIKPSDGWDKNGNRQAEHVFQVHLAEYQALTTRATYFITTSAGIWPLVVLYLAFAVQLWKPSGGSFDESVRTLLQPGRNRWLIWGNLIVLQIMALAWGKLMLEQYKIVLYQESQLATLVRSSVGTAPFWLYERFLSRERRSSKAWNWWEWAVALGELIILSFLFYVLWPLTRSDCYGLVLNLLLFWFMCVTTRQMVMTRRKWETSHGTHVKSLVDAKHTLEPPKHATGENDLH
jgi:hypothetical protein